jgi:hypothetical protein
MSSSRRMFQTLRTWGSRPSPREKKGASLSPERNCRAFAAQSEAPREPLQSRVPPPHTRRASGEACGCEFPAEVPRCPPCPRATPFSSRCAARHEASENRLPPRRGVDAGPRPAGWLDHAKADIRTSTFSSRGSPRFVESELAPLSQPRSRSCSRAPALWVSTSCWATSQEPPNRSIFKPTASSQLTTHISKAKIRPWNL